ncbi:hypothetical protein DCC39_00280 [Pueribacillus theae]|uniref:Uncharacterized protein n=1 Tax=Pueribacillus theae TaxID=2171751 RepID=A0A2U1K8D1_9BACI|nr:hypothetical protein DCC39_00280 [Pueribacillus theae]
MQQQKIWIPLIASVGVGAATFYSMTKNGKSMGQTMQQMVPFVASMGGQSPQSMQGTNTQQANNNKQQQQLQ